MSERIKIKNPEVRVIYLRMPTSLKKRIKKAAEEANLSITAWVTIAIADEIYR